MTNKEIVEALRNVAASYQIKNESKFRFQIIAYQRAADAIENSTNQVQDLLKEGKLEALPGIGPSIKGHLEELVKTGKSKHFDWAMEGIPDCVFKLMEIPRFGPKKSFRLVKEFGLKNKETVIEDLEKLARKGKIAPLAGFGKKSEEDILQAIADYREGKGKTTRMVLPFAYELSEKLVSYLKESKLVKDAEPLGSLRRMKETIGDIDIAVSTDNPKKVIEHFLSYPYLGRVIDKGEFTATILTNLGKQVDLMCMPPDSFGSLLQHFTGSKNHNVHLREFALKKGLSLSEKGIKVLKTGKTLKFKTEEEFYKALSLPVPPPEIREDTGEIELAQKNRLPKLVELKDIKGDFHVHSDYPIEPSHDLGRTSMEEMLERARQLGYEYIGFSEHNPSVSKHTKRQVNDIMKKRKDKIDTLNSSNKYIRVISLLEIDILTDGSLALDDKSFEYLDGAIVSIHSGFSMSREQMTKRILKGLSHPKAKILAHPTGRLLGTRAPYEINFEEICEFIKKENKALEINGYPNRLDLNDNMVRQAKSKGVKLTIDTDSHYIKHMDLMKYGVAVARRGWAEKKDILNTLTFDKFMLWLKS